METEKATQPYQSYYRQDDSIIRYRLDVKEELLRLENNLRGGYYSYYKDEQGKIKNKYIETGDKLVNEKGIQQIMLMLSFLMSKTIVLGWFENSQDRNRFYKTWQKEFSTIVATRKYDWGMDDAGDVKRLLVTICPPIYLFLSRLIGRKDAQGIEKTYNVNETIIPNNKQGFNLGFRRG